MKKLLYIILILTTFLACRSIDKMVEGGRYDDAIIYATEKLAGKKKKKTKHVQGLEEAFQKITQRDLDKIADLDAEHFPQRWEQVLHISEVIQRRQNRIEPFLPLISTDGYEAQFDFIDTRALRNTATYGTARYHYDNGMSLLDRAINRSDKSLARQAYDAFSRTKTFVPAFSDVDLQLDKATDLGTTSILINTVIAADDYIPAHLMRSMTLMDLRFSDSKWRKFYLETPRGTAIDYVANLEIRNIAISPERESISYHTDEKTISDGFRYAKNKRGEFRKDSTGKKIKIEKFKTVYADVTDIHREKSTLVDGLVIMTANNGQPISSHPLTIEVLFEDRSAEYRGDKRALCAHDIKRRRMPRHFPLDEMMIIDASHKLKHNFIQTIHDIRL